MSERNLLPCPFCGGEAKMFPPTCRADDPYDPSDRLYPIVRCVQCYAEVCGDDEDRRGGSAVGAWNRRLRDGRPD